MTPPPTEPNRRPGRVWVPKALLAKSLYFWVWVPFPLLVPFLVSGLGSPFPTGPTPPCYLVRVPSLYIWIWVPYLLGYLSYGSLYLPYVFHVKHLGPLWTGVGLYAPRYTCNLDSYPNNISRLPPLSVTCNIWRVMFPEYPLASWVYLYYIILACDPSFPASEVATGK